MVLVTFWTLHGQLENGAATYGSTRENERNTNTKMRNETTICRSAAIALGFNSLATLAYLSQLYLLYLSCLLLNKCAVIKKLRRLQNTKRSVVNPSLSCSSDIED